MYFLKPLASFAGNGLRASPFLVFRQRQLLVRKYHILFATNLSYVLLPHHLPTLLY